MLDNIKKFFKKNNKQQFENVSSIAIVFNLANHESLMAAVLCDLILTQAKMTTKLIDIRDVFPVTDQYLWIESGSKEVFRAYMSASETSASMKKDAYGTNAILSKSIFFTSSLSEEKKFDDTIAGKIYAWLVEGGYASEPDRKAFARIAMLGVEWLTGLNCKNSAVDASAYYACLQSGYRHYTGEIISLESLISESIGNTVFAAMYAERQKVFGVAIGRRCRYVEIFGKGVQYLNTTGPEVYGIIRRISLSKQNFCHISEGSYGPVIYSSTGIPDVILKERSAFNLTPQYQGVEYVSLRRSA